MYGKCYFEGEMRICAFGLQCLGCSWREVYPLDRHPSPAVVARAREKAGVRACEHCGRTGLSLECMWAYEDPQGTAARAAAHALETNRRNRSGLPLYGPVDRRRPD